MKRFLLTILMALMFVSCATKSPQQNLYSSLDTAVIAYNTAYDTVQDLDSRGKIDDSDKAKIKELFVDTELGLKLAAEALDMYIRVPTLSNKEIFELSITKVFDTLNQIKEFIYE